MAERLRRSLYCSHVVAGSNPGPGRDPKKIETAALVCLVNFAPSYKRPFSQLFGTSLSMSRITFHASPFMMKYNTVEHGKSMLCAGFISISAFIYSFKDASYISTVEARVLILLVRSYTLLVNTLGCIYIFVKTCREPASRSFCFFFFPREFRFVEEHPNIY